MSEEEFYLSKAGTSLQMSDCVLIRMWHGVVIKSYSAAETVSIFVKDGDFFAPALRYRNEGRYREGASI